MEQCLCSMKSVGKGLPGGGEASTRPKGGIDVKELWEMRERMGGASRLPLQHKPH